MIGEKVTIPAEVENNGTFVTGITPGSGNFLVDASAAEPYVGPGQENLTWHIVPKEGLKPGTYQTAVIVSYGYGRTASAQVICPVTEAVQAPPRKLKVSAKIPSSLSLSWRPARGAEKYRVWRASSKGGKYRMIKDFGSSRSHAFTGLKHGPTYYYKMLAYCLYKGDRIYSSYTLPQKCSAKINVPGFFPGPGLCGLSNLLSPDCEAFNGPQSAPLK